VKVKVVTVLGARPQFIKASVVSSQLQKVPHVQEYLVHTGQHYDDQMSDVFFRELGIPRPALNLGIGSGRHGAQTGRMLEAIETVLLEQRPQWLLVYGDTNSTMAAAIAAAKLHIPIAHVESGLRLFDLTIPEEVNRLVTDQLSRFLFAPTTLAVENLKREGISDDRIRMVGDVMFDVAKRFKDVANQTSRVLSTHDLRTGEYVLLTVHRAHNTDDPNRLAAIFEGLARISQQIRVICPLHPRTRNALDQAGLLERFSQSLTLVGPLGYLDMAVLEGNAKLVVTDSGGVQKEAFFYGVPCVTLMGVSPWVELVELGWNHLVEPTDAAAVEGGVRAGLKAPLGRPGQPYGDGNAAAKVVATLVEGSS
jgi:UDP-GlcNAc3NAcA epimerase